MIKTSYFNNIRNLEKTNTAFASIAIGKPKYDIGVELVHIYELKPYGIFGEQNKKIYKWRYFAKLDKLGVEKIAEALKKAQGEAENLVLLCFEKDNSGCHRKMFAEWWQKNTGQEIKEKQNEIYK